MPALAELRAAFPVLERTAFLNAGTQGPVPAAGAEAAAAAARSEAQEGRGDRAHFDSLSELRGRIAARVGELLARPAAEISLTRSTTDGVNTVLGGLDLKPGDEVVTSDEEHPGILAPLAAARRRRGIEVRVAPFDAIAEAVGPRTRLVACSHVSWISGRVVDGEALRAAGAPVLLDGAQGLGAVPVDLDALGCDFYAASGQKWLCGPDASGYLWVRPERLDACAPPWPWYGSLADPADPLTSPPKEGGERYDVGVLSRAQGAWALAALDLLREVGFARVLEQGPRQAARLASRLADDGLEVAPRGATTLVAWRPAGAGDPAAEVERCAAAGVVVRDLPGRGLLRASVGAWTSDEDIERLLAVAVPR